MTTVAAVALAAFGAGCGSEEESVDPPERVLGRITVELEPGAANVAGVQAVLESAGRSRTRVTIEGLGEGEPGGGGVNVAHLHGGTCDEPTRPTHEIRREGRGTVPIALGELLAGEFAIDVHLPRSGATGARGARSEPIACGDIPEPTGAGG